MGDHLTAWHRHKDATAEVFKAMGHPSRLHILNLLGQSESLTIGDLKTMTRLESSNLSQHLAVLRRNRLIAAFRRAGQVNYHLAGPEVSVLMSAARALLDNVAATHSARLKHAVAAQES